MKRIVPEMIYRALPKVKKINGLKRDKLLFMVSEIYCPSLLQIKEDEYFKKIGAKYWKRTIGNGYNDYIHFLTDMEAIEVNRQYEVNEYSRGYSIHKGWCSTPTIIDINDLTLERKLLNPRLPKRNAVPYLDRWVYDQDLTLAPDTLKDFFPLENYKFTKNGEEVKPQGKIYDIATILNFDNGIRKASRDYSSGRYTSPITKASFRVRPYFRYKNKKLIEIDIKASQPTISKIIFNPDFYTLSNHINLFDLFNLNYLDYDIIDFLNIPSNIIMITKTTKYSENQDVKKYIDCVDDGTLYEWLIDLFKDKTGRDISRDDAKFAYCYSVYSSTSICVPPDAKKKIILGNDVKKAWSSECPELFRVFNAYKNITNRVLPILMQRIESHIIIDCVAPEIPKHIPFWTVHDSILTTREHVETVKKLIERKFIEVTGFHAKVEIK